MDKLFEGDYIGYACESLRSRIREVASKLEFEKFHTNATQMLASSLFANHNVTITRAKKQEVEEVVGVLFSKFNFLVFELDVKNITPKDPQIAELLDQSIKSSMKILCKKLNENAEFEAAKEKLESDAEIARLNGNLIEIENANYCKEELEKAKISGAARIENTKATVQADELLENSQIEMSIAQMQEQMELLKGPSGLKYIEFVKALSLNRNVNNVTVVPSGVSTLYVPWKQQ